jgi:hypothetical protein
MMRRFLMRRSYNKGQWSQARTHANKIIHLPKEKELARSVVIRSYWNESQYQKVIHLNSIWGYIFQELADKSRYALATQEPGLSKVHHPRILALHSCQPKPKIRDIVWNPDDMTKNFFQEGQRLWMKHPKGWTHWDMPEKFSLVSTHPALLMLTAEILLSPWVPSTKTDFPYSRAMGTQASLAFSAGTDSTAASFVMPKNTILGYHRRNFSSQLNHKNASRLLNYMGGTMHKNILDVASNHELLRTYHYKQIGFSTDFACATHLILLADAYDIGAIGVGMVLDNTWLWKGRKFREFPQTTYYQYWKKRFTDAGLDLLFPLGGVSEAGAMKICEKENILPFMNSCLRGDGTSGCGACWKCFHKNGPFGRPFDINAKEIQIFLQRRPLPTATHALWALKQMKQESQTPDLKHLLEQDFNWWTSYYPPAREILPARWNKGITDKIAHYLEPMEQPYAVESVNHFEE